MRLEDIIEKNLVIDLEKLKADAELLKQIQKQLSYLGLYPTGRWIDGSYGPRTESAITEFCKTVNLDNMKTGKFDKRFAEVLIKLEGSMFKLYVATSRDQVFKDFLRAEAGYDAYKLAFLDRGINNSPYKADINSYPLRLKEKPDDHEVISLGEKVTQAKTAVTVTFTPYPKVGEFPQIDDKALSFLHSDITEACVCLGSFVGGQFRSRWLGKNSLTLTQFWSATKFIGILNLVSQANSKVPSCDLDNCAVRDPKDGAWFKFYDLVSDVVTYANKLGTSNSIAAMFKRFETYVGLETWLKKITGNTGLVFRGNYGEGAFIEAPELYDQKLKRVIVTAAPASERGGNALSAYDLVRMISMLGWHFYLPQASRLPGAQWDSLESVIRAMGLESARFVDVALEKLGLQSEIKSPVIISKMGFGRSSARNQTEMCYVALVQFIDRRPKAKGKPAKLRTLAMALRGVKGLDDANAEATELDARMAAEVTEIIRRVVTEELV